MLLARLEDPGRHRGHRDAAESKDHGKHGLPVEAHHPKHAVHHDGHAREVARVLQDAEHEEEHRHDRKHDRERVAQCHRDESELAHKEVVQELHELLHQREPGVGRHSVGWPNYLPVELRDRHIVRRRDGKRHRVRNVLHHVLVREGEHRVGRLDGYRADPLLEDRDLEGVHQGACAEQSDEPEYGQKDRSEEEHSLDRVHRPEAQANPE